MESGDFELSRDATLSWDVAKPREIGFVSRGDKTLRGAVARADEVG